VRSGREGAVGAAEILRKGRIMADSIARSIIGTALAAAAALLVIDATGRASAQSSALYLSALDHLPNRYDVPVSETDVGRADQRADFERSELPTFAGSRIFRAR
jgi:hypothetical protein